MDGSNGKKILVVDDDPMIRHILNAILTERGFEVTEADNGEAGMQALQSNGETPPFHLMVLDMMMPKMTGLEVLSALRENPAFTAFPIIMLTAENRTTDIMDGYSAGASYYITKPFTREQILHGIELVLG